MRTSIHRVCAICGRFLAAILTMPATTIVSTAICHVCQITIRNRGSFISDVRSLPRSGAPAPERTVPRLLPRVLTEEAGASVQCVPRLEPRNKGLGITSHRCLLPVDRAVGEVDRCRRARIFVLQPDASSEAEFRRQRANQPFRRRFRGSPSEAELWVSRESFWQKACRFKSSHWSQAVTETNSPARGLRLQPKADGHKKHKKARKCSLVCLRR